jgi:hypothetical protein
MKKRIFITVTLVCTICLIVITCGYASKNMDFFKWGQQVSSIKNSPSNEVAVIVNNVSISKDKFNSYKAGLVTANDKITDKEVMDKLIKQEVIRQEVERLGYTVTEKEVDAFNDERFSLLEEYPEAYKITKEYVDGLGITMEQYKEMSKKISKDVLLSNKYKADMQKKFENENKENRSLNDYEKTVNFENYFNNVINELCKNAEIEIID